ncbi:WD_REPEATS_REGION domain-containing protein [Haematococcus lacustris]|uniref:WD_REPEATS_REGION domain-containing protein n=1 Tax=Haematococcus lacustris TaxID=44745 RepID=A0A699Z1M8_HAELA|nr:WD_REPEATS_REGION domain-containing protein [Haematococcus lacustris]
MCQILLTDSNCCGAKHGSPHQVWQYSLGVSTGYQGCSNVNCDVEGPAAGMAEPLRPKLTYRPQRKLEVFFTGGVARISRDGKLLACGCGEEVKDSEPVSALAISPDCKTLVVASRSCTCRVIDLTSGELKRSWRGHKAPIADVVVDASGGWVLRPRSPTSMTMSMQATTHHANSHQPMSTKRGISEEQYSGNGAGNGASWPGWWQHACR